MTTTAAAPAPVTTTTAVTLGSLQKQQQHKISPTKLQQSKSSSNNIALTSNEMRIHSVELLSQFSESITDLVAGWSDFHTYWEHRLKVCSSCGFMRKVECNKYIFFKKILAFRTLI